MHKVSFDCTVLTPLFIAGADQYQAEMRASSIRGAMRYWYRALLGKAGYDDPKELSVQESKVFGDTERASPLTVRVNPTTSARCGEAKELLKRMRDSGTGYLWYSTTMKPNNRSYFQPDWHFKVTLSTLKDRSVLQRAVAAFWLLANFGGLGTRSRRGAGSFIAAVREHPKDMTFPYFEKGVPEAESMASFFEHVAAILPSVNGSGETPDFDSLGAAEIYYHALGVDSGLDAVEEIGLQFKEFRHMMGSADNDPLGTGEDYATLTRFLQSGPAPKTVMRASFGLPLDFRFKKIRKNAKVKAANYTRRSSPLWIRISRTKEGEYGAVLTYFKSTFLPHPGKLKVNGRPINAPPKSLIPMFIDTLSPIKKVYAS